MSGRYNALSRRRGSRMKKLQNNHKLGQTDDLRKCDLNKSFAQPKEWEYPNSPQEKTKSQYISHTEAYDNQVAHQNVHWVRQFTPQNVVVSQ